MFKSTPVIRLVVYGLALFAMATSFFMTAIESPLAPAFVQTANLLGAAAGVGAISNLGTLSGRPGDLDIDSDPVAVVGSGAQFGAEAIMEPPVGRFAAPVDPQESAGRDASTPDSSPRHARRPRNIPE